ncbi:MAG: two component transcriptional regulator, winged helix family [Firmicutes bacterium]|nr:two component transcriptional regulator, winged helix family [Bacillota bacterium]
MHILVIEDDPTLSNMLQLYLDKAGYRVTVARDGASGLAAALSMPVDLIMLDLMLPQLDGWAICARVRERSAVPILLLTALDQEAQKVQGLDLGADDYVTKPFNMAELLARVRAMLRRNWGPAPAAGETTLIFDGLRLDPVSRIVELNGSRVDLTPKEFDLLYLLASEPGKVFSRDELLQRVWQYPVGTDPRTLHTHILRLRRKLEVEGRTFLQTVWGVGFKFEATAS